MDRGVPCGPINTIDQGFALAAELGLDPVVRIPQVAEQGRDLVQDGAVTPPTVATVANPIRLSRTPAVYRSGPPVLGQDGQAGVITGDAGRAAGTQAGPGVSS
jgi:crotonobetainyl-CoA:carnitine CoA-transferase CaiB-like acyl-CoA transferase